MASKIMPIRTVQKRDTTSNWLKNPDFVPMNGEIIIYTDYAVTKDLTVPNLKIGDGVTKVNELSFLCSGLDLYPRTSRVERSLDYLWKKSKGIVYDTETVESLADADVPSGAMEYAELQTLGGVSRKGNNLLNSEFASRTAKGVTLTRLTPTEFVLNGTTDTGGDIQITYTSLNPLKGKNITVSTDFPYTTSSFIHVWDGATHRAMPSVSFILSETFDNPNMAVHFGVNDTFNNVHFKVMLEEGSIAHDYEPYTDTLIDAKVDEVVSRGRNLIPFPYSGGQTVTRKGITFTQLDDGGLHIGGNNDDTDNSYYNFANQGILQIAKGTNLTFSTIGLNSNVNVVIVEKSQEDETLQGVTLTSKRNSASLTILGDTSKIVVYAYASKGSQNVDVTIYPMLELGTTATTYTPYHTPITTPIPQSILDLPDYGIGVSADCYNYVDFVERKYHRRVGSVDLGSLKWSLSSNGYYVADFKNKGIYTNILCCKYNNTDDYRLKIDKTIGVNDNYVVINDTDYSDAISFKNAMQGQILYYELAEEEIIDISSILTDEDFNILSVESGGTVQFNYPNKENYSCDTPNKIEYMIEVDKV